MSHPSNANYSIVENDASLYKRQRKYLLIAVGCLAVACVGLLVALILAGSKAQPHIQPTEETYCLSTACTLSAAEVIKSSNQSQDPCQDFYDYVCGNEAPPDEHIPILSTENSPILRTTAKVQEEMSNLIYSADPDTVPIAISKAIRLMQTCVQFVNISSDTNIAILRNAIEELGGWPLASPGEWNEKKELPFHVLVSKFIRSGFPINLMEFSVEHDINNKEKHIIMFSQVSENAMGDEPWKHKYIHLFANWLGNNDSKSIDDALKEISELKEDITQIMVSRGDAMNPTLMYNKMKLGEFQTMTNNKIDWLSLLNEVFKGILKLNTSEEIVVSELPFFKNLSSITDKYNTRIFANYFIMNMLLEVLNHADAHLKTEEERLTPCYSWISESMPQATGRLYLENFFKEANRKKVKNLVDEIKEAYRDTITKTALMDEETRVTAMKKVDSMQVIYAYSDWVFNDDILNEVYEMVGVTDNHLLNIISNYKNDSIHTLKQLRALPNNRSTAFKPTNVNAQYDPTKNQFLVDAAFLQPPFFDEDYTLAKNFGSLGFIIAHEIGHGFDSSGRTFDDQGFLREWWTEESLNRFDEKSKCFIEQYDQYCPTEYLSEEENNTCVDGTYTLVENMADDSGLHLAYKAYKSAAKKLGKYEKLPGFADFTQDQIFFISFTSFLCESLKIGMYTATYGTEEHTISKYRAIGTLSNFPPFAKAFNCPAGPMNRKEERCSLWE